MSDSLAQNGREYGAGARNPLIHPSTRKSRSRRYPPAATETLPSLSHPYAHSSPQEQQEYLPGTEEGGIEEDNEDDDYHENLILAEAATRIEHDLAYDERSDDVLDRIRTRDNGSYVYEPSRPILTRVYEGLVPHTITDQYAAMKYASFMGLFPEINRAWITVDNKLFLWNYQDGSVYAYTDLTQVIVTAAIVRPTPGVFTERIKFALVLATPVEVVMLGVEFADDNVYGELRLWPTHFRIPSDNVHMLKIVGTEHGRIFMAGKDGCLYEFVYQERAGGRGLGGGGSWLNPLSWIGNVVGSPILSTDGSNSWMGGVQLTAAAKARKLNHSQSTLGRLFPGFLLGGVRDPIVQLILDESRSPALLYTLSRDKHVLQQWSLGSPEADNRTALPGAPLVFLYQNQDLLSEVRSLGVSNSTVNGSSGRSRGSSGHSRGSIIGRGSSDASSLASSRGPSVSLDDWSKETFRILDIAAIPASESERRLLVAVTSHGHRIYIGRKLRAKFVRKCPPYVDPSAVVRPAGSEGSAAGLVHSHQHQFSLKNPDFRPSTSPRLVRRAFVAGELVLLADERDRDRGQSLVALIRQPPQRELIPATSSTDLTGGPGVSSSSGGRYGYATPVTNRYLNRRFGSGTSAWSLSGSTSRSRKHLNETVELQPLHTSAPGRGTNRVADIQEVDVNFYLSLQASCLYKRGLSEPLAGLSECATQHALARRQFLVLTTAGLLIFTKQRPVDELRESLGLWRENGDTSLVEAIFRQYGAREACAMCLIVACGPPNQYDDGLSGPLLEAAMHDEEDDDDGEDTLEESGDGDIDSISDLRDPDDSSEWSRRRRRTQRLRRRLVARIPDEELIRFATQAFFTYGDPNSHFHREQAKQLRQEQRGGAESFFEDSESDLEGPGTMNTSAGYPVLPSHESPYALRASAAVLARRTPDPNLTGLDSDGNPGKHSGLTLYLSRLLRSVWDWTITVIPSEESLSPAEMEDLEHMHREFHERYGWDPEHGSDPSTSGGGDPAPARNGENGPSTTSGSLDDMELVSPRGHRRHQHQSGSTRKRTRRLDASIKRSPPVYQRLRFSREHILELQAPLLRLLTFVGRHREQFEASATEEERQALFGLYKLLTVSIEAFHLLEVLSRVHHFPRIVARLPESQQAELRATKFYRLATEEGRNLARSLLAAMMEADPVHREWTSELYTRCRWFFGRSDLLHHTAGKALQAALQLLRVPGGGSRRAQESRRLLDEAMWQFQKASESSQFSRLESVCQELRRAGLFAGVVQLCLHRARKLASGEISPPASVLMDAEASGGSTPRQRQSPAGPSGETPARGLYQSRQTPREWIQTQIDRCYDCVFDTLAFLTSDQQPVSINNFQSNVDSGPVSLTPEERETQRQLVLQECLKSQEERFHFRLYDWLIRHDRQQQDLMNLRSPFVISFLQSRLSKTTIEILKDYLIHHELYAEAAKLLANQARLVSPGLSYTLQERQGMLNQASMYARQWGEEAGTSAFAGTDKVRDRSGIRKALGLPLTSVGLTADDLADLEDRKLVCRLQVQVQEQLLSHRDTLFRTGGGLGPQQRQEALAQIDQDLEILNSRLLDIQQLWQLARGNRLWESCLSILSVAQTPQDDRNVAYHLWSSIIEAEIAKAADTGLQDWSSSVNLKLRQLVQRHREQLGGAVFPLRALIMMLESINFKDRHRPTARGYPPTALLSAGVSSLVLLDHYDQLTEPNGYSSSRPVEERVMIWWSVRELLLAHNQQLLQQSRRLGPSGAAGHFQGLNIFNKCVVAINRLPKNPEIQELGAAFEELRRKFRLP